MAKAGKIPGLRGRWLAHASDDPDAGYTMSLWENEAAMPAYESSDTLQKQSCRNSNLSSRTITRQRAAKSGSLKNSIKRRVLVSPRQAFRCGARHRDSRPTLATRSSWLSEKSMCSSFVVPRLPERVARQVILERMARRGGDRMTREECLPASRRASACDICSRASGSGQGPPTGFTSSSLRLSDRGCSASKFRRRCSPAPTR